MEKNKNFKKLIIANKIKFFSIIFFPPCVYAAFNEIRAGEVYWFSQIIILIFADIIVFCIMDFWIKWIVFGKCDFLAQEKYILSLLKWKGYKDDVTLHKELLCDSLILGKYDEARQEIEKLRRLDGRLKPMQRLVVQLCIIDYMKAVNETESLNTELKKAENLLASLSVKRDRIIQKYQRGIRSRQHLIEERWEDVLELLRTIPQKNLTVFEQVVNAYVCGKCCYCLDRYEEAFHELKFAARYGGNTKYVKLANELIKKIPQKNLYENKSTVNLIKVNHRINFKVIVLAISCLLVILLIRINFYCSNGSSFEEIYSRRYWCAQDELTVIYQKNIGKYDLVILREGEKEAYCLFEESGSAFKMVESFRLVRNQTEPIGIELPEDVEEFFREGDMVGEIYAVLKGFYKKNNIFNQEDMIYVGVCSLPIAENIVVNGSPVSIEQIIYIDDVAVYLWSVENIDLKTNLQVEYVAE